MKILLIFLISCAHIIPQEERSQRLAEVEVLEEIPTDRNCVSIALASLMARSTDRIWAIDQLKHKVASRNGNVLIIEKEHRNNSPVSWEMSGNGYGCD